MATLILTITYLTSWLFSMGDTLPPYSSTPLPLTTPHDWAITTPFDRANDLQTVAVVQNGETTATAKTGRSGGLNWFGEAQYKTSITLRDRRDSVYTLYCDGAMSHAKVYVNDSLVTYWPYGYNAFYCDITPYLHDGDNEIIFRLHNHPESSRWYPGAGLYRQVKLYRQAHTHIPVWGVHITNDTILVDVANRTPSTRVEIEREKVGLWSPESPNVGIAKIRVYDGNRLVDERNETYGYRTLEFKPDSGFYLNGVRTQFKGVCLHHDLGPLGTAVHRDALRHQLTMLKQMGCNAVRTTHNMPSTELVELCDSMGLMVVVEAFDTWTRPKGKNDYHNEFNEWWERDITNMVLHFRNHPSVVMWSIGNEVWDQTLPDGPQTAKMLQDKVHELDSTRLVTCGCDQVTAIMNNGFGEVLDIPGLNYRTCHYEEAYQKLPQRMLLGSETASTVSSRGTYTFPVVIQPDVMRPGNQSSGYDVEYCSWSGLPDYDFALADDNDWHLGQFVWTGFDYLGEPSPYDTDAWPSHSSYFGIIDLSSLPKDRYYLYKSQWDTTSPTLHVLPHWTWQGREGQETPIFVYTSYPEAEVFINGVSQGRQRFGQSEPPTVGDFDIASWGCAPEPNLLSRYRLMWMHTVYEPGELRVVAYNEAGEAVAEQVVKTAGKPHHLVAQWANEEEHPEELNYITVSVVDKYGNLCPEANHLITATGPVKAAANGDPTCLYPMQPFGLSAYQPISLNMPVFKGQCTFIVTNGTTTFNSKGLKSTKITINH